LIVANPETLYPGSSISVTINDLRWQYYQIEILKPIGWMYLRIAKTTNRGVLQLYASKGRYPTGPDDADAGLIVFPRQVDYQMTFEYPVGVYYVGVFSSSVYVNATYTLELDCRPSSHLYLL
jgi:hypothetical protein